jgi:hypothetical protein
MSSTNQFLVPSLHVGLKIKLLDKSACLFYCLRLAVVRKAISARFFRSNPLIKTTVRLI